MKRKGFLTFIAAASVAGIALAGCSGDANEGNDIQTETEVSESDISDTTLATNTTITTSETDPKVAQEAEYIRYLKELYDGADEYAQGFPQKVSGIDEGFASATTYLKYAIADFDGDGKLELMTVESNNFPVESGKTAENIDKGYLTFRIFNTTDAGGIIEGDKINGLSNGVSFSEYEKTLKSYDNGVTAIDQTAAVNAAWDYTYDEVKAFLYFDDAIVKKLNVPLMNEYLESDWASDNSSYVMMRINEGKYEICLGGAQDSYTEMTELTKEQYDSMEKMLTDGKEVDVQFKDITKDGLGI